MDLGARWHLGRLHAGPRSRSLPWKRLGRFGSCGRFGSRIRGGARNGSGGEERGRSTRGKRWSRWRRGRPRERRWLARFDGRTGCEIRGPACVRAEKRNVQARPFAAACGVGWKGRHRLAVCPRCAARFCDGQGGRRPGRRKEARRRGRCSAVPARAQSGLRLRARQGSHFLGGRNLAVRRCGDLAAGPGRAAAQQGAPAQRRRKFLGPRDLRKTGRSAYS